MQLPVLTAPSDPTATRIDHPAIRLRDVCVRLGSADILQSVTADVPCGALTAIIGPNGAGKTTLLHAILGLVPHSGRIEFCPVHAVHGTAEDRPRTRQARVAYVPQRLDFDRHLPIRVLDFLAMQSQRRPLWLGVSRQIRLDAQKALAELDAEHLLLARLGQLSGGELQRVLLAAAAMRQPDILLLDEPVSGVDALGMQLFCDLLERLAQHLRCTMVLVSHDLSVVNQHARYVIFLNRSVICCGSPSEVLRSDKLIDLYGGPVRLYLHHH